MTTRPPCASTGTVARRDSGRRIPEQTGESIVELVPAPSVRLVDDTPRSGACLGSETSLPLSGDFCPAVWGRGASALTFGDSVCLPKALRVSSNRTTAGFFQRLAAWVSLIHLLCRRRTS